MHRVWPPEKAGALQATDLEALYGYPSDRPQWLAANFVASADGAMEIAGRSGGLSNTADRKVYPLGSDLADVVLVGATTAIAEEFRGIRPSQEAAERRARHGLAPIPPIAVVTSGRSLPADAPVITEAPVPTIVITCASAPTELQRAWRSEGAEPLVAGADAVDLAGAMDGLAERGLNRIHCDGGPRLFGAALRAGIVDELRLTMSPMLVSGGADRIASGLGIEPTALNLDSVLVEEDTLLLRYLLKR